MYKKILKQYWGYDSFRGIQQEIIESIGSGKDTLGLMPTGGGKSITFQVPALAKEGLCLVITPLIALMKDQVQNLKRRGIRALAIYSGMNRQDIVTTLENCIFGNYKFLYISPERLDSELFQTKLKKMNVSMITVDESHCISQWGYDFRPAYLKIADIRQLLPNVPILALTATATPEVVSDIQARLGFKQENVFRMSFERKNLAYVVRNTDNKTDELLYILRKMSGSAIVYVRNRRKTKEIAELLKNEQITAEFYHAGLDNTAKDIREQLWKNGKSRVMVATNAFGMGIDKPDVRLVIHMDLPDSIEAYFQEAGRAGRDGEKAYSVILYSNADKARLQKRIPDNFPEKEYIREVYEHVQYYYQMAMGDGQGCMRPFDLEDFCRKFKHFPIQADSALRILTQAGYLEYTDSQENASRLLFTLKRDELYKLRETDETTEMLIQTILRSYTGLFTDYVFISEKALSTRTGLTLQEIYERLVGLAQRGIVHYIPQKNTPYIIYTRARVEKQEIHITPEVYEERKKRFQLRIEHMIEYATAYYPCRSRMLLSYFGEKNNHNCGICDTCVSLRKGEKMLPETDMSKLQEQVMALLSEEPQFPHVIAKKLGADKEALALLLRHLLENEQLIMNNGKIQINPKS